MSLRCAFFINEAVFLVKSKTSGLGTTVLVLGQLYWCWDNCTGVGTTVLVLGQLYWCWDNCTGLGTTVLVLGQLYPSARLSGFLNYEMSD
jgi:hypothetical protein